jgi:hypothetical protein
MSSKADRRNLLEIGGASTTKKKQEKERWTGDMEIDCLTRIAEGIFGRKMVEATHSELGKMSIGAKSAWD